jgi:hypothetical protein
MIESSQKAIREGKFAAAAAISGGAILLSLGTWRLVEDPPESQYTRGLGVMFTTLGAADLTTGIFIARRAPDGKRRLDRWEQAKKEGVTEVELARAESELLTSAEFRETARKLLRWNGLTHALAGVVVLGLTPVPNARRPDTRSGWIIGSIFVATGAAAFGLSFRPTPTEAAWNAYRANQATTDRRQVSWRMSPSISRKSLGLCLSGTF